MPPAKTSGFRRSLVYEEVPHGFPIYEFRLYMFQHVPLARKRHHLQGSFEGNPSKFAVLVIDDHRRIDIHEADEDRQHGDGVPISLIKLLAYVGGIKPIADKARFLADFT